MRVMTKRWGVLQLSGCVYDERILYKDLIICREAAYLNIRLEQTGEDRAFS